MSTAAERFIAEIRAQGKPMGKRLSSAIYLFGGASSVELVPSGPREVYLQRIRTFEAGGKGSATLKLLTTTADQLGVDLVLVVNPFDTKSLDAPALTAWYGRYGFLPDDGAEEAGTMNRRPRTASTSGSLVLHGEPYRYADYDIREGLDRIADSVDTRAYGGDLDPAYFRIKRTYMTVAEISRIANPDYWLDVERGEIGGADDSDLYAWARQYGGDRFAYNVDDMIENGMSAIVLMDTPMFRGLLDGRGRLNVAVALAETAPLPVLLLRDYEDHRAKEVPSKQRSVRRAQRRSVETHAGYPGRGCRARRAELRS